MVKKRKTKADVMRAIARGGASAARAAGEFADRHHGSLSKTGEVAVKTTGVVTEATGAAIESMAGTADRWAGGYAAKSDSLAGKALGRTVQGTAKAIRLGGWLVENLGSKVRKYSKDAGDAASGAVAGALKTGANAIDGIAISAADIQRMRSALIAWGSIEQAEATALRRSIDEAVAKRRRENLLELLTVGGVTLAEAIRAPSSVPDEVLAAYSLAYPDLAQRFTFQEAVERLDASQLVGFASGVKGKLFELELVDHLNSDVLGDGYHASMAESATQEGWDIQVTGPDGATVDWIQAKATDSVDYVRQAIERYPDIDVTTTSEVYAELMARGMAEGVHNSGIAEAALDAAVQGGIEAAHGHISGLDLLPGGIGLAAIGLTVFFDRTVPDAIKARKAGKQIGQAMIPMALGKAALVVSQLWWVGLVAGAGSSWLAGKGRVKRAQFDSLRDVMRTLEL
jgi:hypothetical protein